MSLLRIPLPTLALGLSISAHLIAEVLRRFGGWSDLAYGLADIGVLMATLGVIRRCGVRLVKRGGTGAGLNLKSIASSPNMQNRLI